MITPKARSLQAVLFILCMLLVPASLFSQDVQTPRIQVFAGYSRLQFDSKSFGFSQNTGLNGWTGSLSYNLHPNFGVTGEVFGHYGSNFRVAGWQVGPQGIYQRWGVLMFGHLLFGKGQTRISTTEVETQTGRAVTVGGGVDVPIGDRFLVRVVQVDYVRLHTFDLDQNSPRFSTGLVYRWGGVGKKAKTKVTAP